MHIYDLEEPLTQLCICLLQQIMKDRWINAGSEEDELKPFVEPELDISDQKRIGIRSALHYMQLFLETNYCRTGGFKVKNVTFTFYITLKFLVFLF